MTAPHFTLTLGESEYEVRHQAGRITGCTRMDIGRHVESGELIALASRLGLVPRLVEQLRVHAALAAIEEHAK